MRTRTKTILFLMTFLLYSGHAKADLTTIDMPGASHTFLTGIDGSNLVGYYYDAFGTHGFLHNMTSGTWTTLDASGATHTYIYDIEGSNLVGWYRDASAKSHGFVYNGTSWVILDKPGAGEWGTEIYGIDGSNLVGSYSDSSYNPHGFLYNSVDESWATLDYPGTTTYTRAPGISGNNIVIYYGISGDGYHTGLYNGIDWTNIDKPGAIETRGYDIDGSNIVGWYENSEGVRQGFLYDLNGKNWTILDTPDGSIPWGMDGSNLVGYYPNSEGVYHGFIYIIPEPATLLLLGFGAVMLRRKKLN